MCVCVRGWVCRPTARSYFEERLPKCMLMVCVNGCMLSRCVRQPDDSFGVVWTTDTFTLVPVVYMHTSINKIFTQEKKTTSLSSPFEPLHMHVNKMKVEN